MWQVLILGLAGPARAQSVVGGDPVPEGRWEDAAAVYFGNQVGCTGVLVAPRVVLTAGHCVGGITKVKLATNDYTEGGETIGVERTYEHQSSQSTYDIAVLVLEEDAQTPPRLIAQDCILDRYLKDGEKVQIVGYGATNYSGTQYGTILNEGQTVIEDADCTQMSLGCNGSVSPGGELGAGGNDVDACYGDSGGPLYLSTPEGDFLIGITSRGYNNSSVPCRDGGIYVRPDAVIDWIEEVSGASLPAPDCSPNEPPEPSAKAIVILQGREGRTRVVPNDPDEGDTFAFSIAEPPEHGEAELAEGGVVVYTPDPDYVGEDALTVVVSDGQDEAELTIDVTIAAREAGAAVPGGCGCGAAGGLGGGLLAGLAALAAGARRRIRK